MRPALPLVALLALLALFAGDAIAQPSPEVAPVYPWLADAQPQRVDGSIASRFAAPDGFRRVALQAGSFGAWLRRLPLAPAGTGVVSFRGDPVLAADDEHLAAVVAIDAGTRDLMQCADSVIRMHAEWRWSNGARDEAYHALSGAELPFARYLHGERPRAVGEHGEHIVWVGALPMPDNHSHFRVYLDDVFTWANTVSLKAESKAVAREDAAPGDFFVQPGAPGHAVLIVDVARDAAGKTALLLAQGYMPAQGFYVVRPSRASSWFVPGAEDTTIATPFWRPFSWSDLRRL